MNLFECPRCRFSLTGDADPDENAGTRCLAVLPWLREKAGTGKEHHAMIQLKRVYEDATAEDGYRVLVERLWPRGLSRERARIDLWVKDAGASTTLRKWYGHDPDRWETFRERYFLELSERPDVIDQLDEVVRTHSSVTFLFSAHDTAHNNAVALKQYLESRETPV